MPDYSVPRTARRVPIERQVRLKFENLRGFATEVSGNVSLGGMFIKTASPPPVGTLLELEFTLDDTTELIRGTGKVIWARQEAAGPDAPSGMGLRFVKLSPGSRELIFKIVDQYIQQGGDPFDVDRLPAPPPAAPTPAPLAASAPPEPQTPDLSDALGEPGDPAELDWNLDGEGELLTILDLPEEPAFEAPPPASEAGMAFAGPADPPVDPPADSPQEPPSRPRKPSLEEVIAGSVGDPLRPAAGSVLTPPSPEAPAPEAPPAIQREATGVHLRGYGRAGKPSRSSRRWPLVAGIVVVAGALAAAGLWWLSASSTDTGGDTGDTGEVAAVPAPDAGEPAAAAAGPVEVEELGGTAAPENPLGAPPPPAAPAASPAPEPPAASSPALHRLRDITWRRVGEATEVVLTGDGRITEASFTRFRLEGASPREVIKLQGIDGPFDRPRVAVGSPQLQQVRTGYHAGAGGTGELHVVLDLTGPRVRLSTVEAEGNRLVLRLEGS